MVSHLKLSQSALNKTAVSVKKLVLIFFIFTLLCLLYYFAITTEPLDIKYGDQIENDSMATSCNENPVERRKSFGGTTSSVTAEDELLYNTDASTTQRLVEMIPIIYFVTPSYPRREQFAELTRLGNTLMHIPNLHWIVADDNPSCNNYLDILLNQFGIPYTHISSPMPDTYRTHKLVPRGVSNRRAALNWIRANNKSKGVLYFGDDDNSYSLKLFSEIRFTKKVAMFPVGLIGDYAVSSPVVKNGKVVGFFDSWPAKRKWPVDMAGFAVNLEFMNIHPNATMPYKAGYEEDEFLRNIHLKMEDIEPKANNCTEVLVWHTQTTKSKAPVIKINADMLKEDKSSLKMLIKELENLGVSKISNSGGVKATITRDGKSKILSSWFN